MYGIWIFAPVSEQAQYLYVVSDPRDKYARFIPLWKPAQKGEYQPAHRISERADKKVRNWRSEGEIDLSLRCTDWSMQGMQKMHGDRLLCSER